MKLFYLILSAVLFTANAQETTPVTITTTLAPATTTTTLAPATTTTTLAPATITTTLAPASSATPLPTTVVTGASTATPSAGPPDGSTTQPPTPSPSHFFDGEAPTSSDFNITGTGSDYCVLVTLAMQFNLTYETNGSLSWMVFNLPNNTVVNVIGECTSNSNDQNITLSWEENDFNLTFNFKKYPGDTDYGLTDMTFNYTLKSVEIFPDAIERSKLYSVKTSRLDTNTESDYRIDQGGSFWCKNNYTLYFENKWNGTAYVKSEPTLLKTTISNFKYQAFTDNLKSYSTYTECASDFGTSDIVPIAVGCALAALVVIVLIAYLIGRRRSRQKGYQSV